MYCGKIAFFNEEKGWKKTDVKVIDYRNYISPDVWYAYLYYITKNLEIRERRAMCIEFNRFFFLNNVYL